MELHTVGINLGKTVFHLVGLNLRGEVAVRKKFRVRDNTPGTSSFTSHKPVSRPREQHLREADYTAELHTRPSPFVQFPCECYAVGRKVQLSQGRRGLYHSVRDVRRIQVSVIAIVRIIATFSSGLLAGILFGDRMGATFARPSLSPSSFLQFQRIQHIQFARMMPPLTLAAIAGALGWLVMVRAQWNSSQFGLVAAATGTMVFAAALTLRVNIPINNQLMTWSVAAPPENMREIWNRWEKVHTIRTILWLGAFAFEVIVLGVLASANTNTSLP